MSTRCIAAGCSKTTKDGVSLQSGPVRRLFQRRQQALRAVVLRESGIHYTIRHGDNKSFLKQDAIPTTCPAKTEVEEGT